MINLTSQVFQVTAILKPTKAKVLKDIKVGDCLQLKVQVATAGSNRGRTYATEIEIHHLNTGQVAYKTFNQIESVLASFSLMEVAQ